MVKVGKAMKLSREAEIVMLAYEALEQCLAQVPFAALDTTSLERNGDRGADLLAYLRLPTGKRRLIAEVKNSGEPRRARDAINQLYRYREYYPDAYPIFIAPYISPRSAALCEEEGVGYLDLAGNCRLAFDQVYIKQEGHPNPYSEKRSPGSLYGAKAERVLRVLFACPGKRWKVQEMAQEAGVSLGQVAKIKALLTDQEWVKTEPDGFRLSEPQALLTDWAENYRYRRNEIREFYSLLSVAEIEHALADAANQAGIRYALTGFSAAARFAPFVRYGRAVAYVATAAELEELSAKLKLKPVTTGANLSLLLPYDEGVFYDARSIDSERVVTPVQCYLDVQSVPARGKEAAEAFLHDVLLPQWRANL
jgi:hypothetical protein